MSITVLHTDIIKQLFKLNYKISIIQRFICYAQLFHTHTYTRIHTHTHTYTHIHTYRHTTMHAHTFIL